MLFKRVLLFRLVSTSFALSVRSVYQSATALPFGTTVTSWLDQQSITWKLSNEFPLGRYNVLEVGNSRQFLLHVIPSPMPCSDDNDYKPMSPSLCKHMTDAATLTSSSSSSSLDIVHLHQDVWQQQTEIVQSRLRVKTGMETRRIYARKTTVKRITNDVARAFFLKHHLWGATKAKYIYGLFVVSTESDKTEEELVAAASFSSSRTILRQHVLFQSHELLRFCTQRETTVVGGLTKLITAFVREQEPDDMVTQIDRDWGGGVGWCKLGFASVSVMPPLVMAMSNDGTRRHLVGAGIRAANSESAHRVGLPTETLHQLSQLENAKAAVELLRAHGFSPVYDSGVERLCMLVPSSKAVRALQRENEDWRATDDDTTKAVWDDSVPKYPSEYYSPNSGILELLKHASESREEVLL
ncbi:hypothetical protein MPSEU_000592100 [Mayamaea pseudoterrestris]|nr:hypothetical protein MPSEU_000592100 [Mayamaea pseudoterrestris]